MPSYGVIRDQSRQALRQALLDAASRLLVEEGLSALTMRRIAAEVGCTSSVLYTHFGNKEELIQTLWIEGFERLWRAEEVVINASGPLDLLRELAWAYRTNALENPDYYQVMFGAAVPGFHPPPALWKQSRRTFQVLVDAVRGCIEAGIFRSDDPELVASVLWATVHGVVSLQLAGRFEEAEGRILFEHALQAVGSGFRADGLQGGTAQTGGRRQEGSET